MFAFRGTAVLADRRKHGLRRWPRRGHSEALVRGQEGLALARVKAQLVCKGRLGSALLGSAYGTRAGCQKPFACEVNQISVCKNVWVTIKRLLLCVSQSDRLGKLREFNYCTDCVSGCQYSFQ